MILIKPKNSVEVYNENCIDFMQKYKSKVSCILTSPPYNPGRFSTSERSRNNNEGRYDVHIDNMTADEYIHWTLELFNNFDKVLEKNGVILYNLSYGNDATVNTDSVGLMWLVIAEIIKNSNFTIADRIIWKKKNALPNNVSSNKLTRIVEDVFVIVRKSEFRTFRCNKEVTSVSSKGQKFYSCMYNFIEAPNNDGKCNLNKATFSTEFAYKLLNMYCKPSDIVYDPFGGTGTTMLACKKYKCRGISTELSADQCKYAKQRLLESEVIK